MIFKWSLKEKKINADSKKKKKSNLLDKNTKNNISKHKSYSSKKNNVFSKLKKSLLKTRKIISGNINIEFNNKKKFDKNLLAKLEEILITSDISVNTSVELVKSVSKYKHNLLDSNDIKKILKKEILKILIKKKKKYISNESPYIYMIVGVNGVGKSSTIGKLASLEAKKGKKTVIAASDTFRAAASEQIETYSIQAGAHIVKKSNKSDPASVAYDAISTAITNNFDTVFIDTAGRIHTELNLMNELCRIKKIINKKIKNAPHEIILIIDSTTGQNSINQVKIFNKLLGITSIIITKLDSNSKGGTIIDIIKNFKIPIKYITTGEKINDIESFNPKSFVESIF